MPSPSSACLKLPEPASEPARPRVGASACLLGEQVRFDGGHKQSKFVVNRLSKLVEFVPVCPEVAAGMPVPRETLRLLRRGSSTSVVGNRSAHDYTAQLQGAAQEQAELLARLDLDGFILKKDSPSCGLKRVRVYRPGDFPPDRSGQGLFASALTEALPNLPCTEDGWLNDTVLREAFLEQVFTHHRMRLRLFASDSPSELVSFHADHKLLFMAHSPALAKQLGRIVASIGSQPYVFIRSNYVALAMHALGERATRGKHVNVLQHIIGYFKRILSPDEKRELLELIGDFRAGTYDLVVPLTLIRHYIRKHDPSPWLRRQIYFQPYPQL